MHMRSVNFPNIVYDYLSSSDFPGTLREVVSLEGRS